MGIYVYGKNRPTNNRMVYHLLSMQRDDIIVWNIYERRAMTVYIYYYRILRYKQERTSIN